MGGEGKVSRVFVKNLGRDVLCMSSKTFLDCLREAGISIRADCGGIGECGKCRIVVEKGLASPLTESEKSILSAEDISKGFRLACQARVLGESYVVLVPQESLVQRYVSADVGFEIEVPLDPLVKKVFVSVNPASLNDVTADLDRILDMLSKKTLASDYDVDAHIARIVPEVLRSGNWSVTVVLWRNKILSIEPGDTTNSIYGIAVDIGTSKIVAHLVDLVKGETIAVESMPNPQASYGADIISRIAYASRDKENLEKLQKLVVTAINMLIEKMSSRANVDKNRIYEVVIAGNTAMHHLFLGINPRYLGSSPYVPAVRRSVYLHAREVGLNINERGVVYALPIVAGYVGSDALADAVAVGLRDCNAPCLLIDIGTNSEILLNTGNEILACSTPAGPAFEGATIEFGMRAVVGAIDQVFIYFDKSIGDYNVRYNVVGNSKPVGICGSAMIDLIANLYRNNLIDYRGRFRKDIKSKRMVVDNGKKFVVAWDHETGIGRSITVSGKDINEFLLAKAAVASGVNILLKHANISVNDLQKIFIAGSFGTHINIDNAIAIGLLPKVDARKFVFVGNTAISGAKMALKSSKIRREFEGLAKNIKYIELSIHPLFKQEFIQALYLPKQY
ncbi:MAG: ASKHA domain-containing protein [Ignisphaera sp.]